MLFIEIDEFLLYNIDLLLKPCENLGVNLLELFEENNLTEDISANGLRVALIDYEIFYCSHQMAVFPLELLIPL